MRLIGVEAFQPYNRNRNEFKKEFLARSQGKFLDQKETLLTTPYEDRISSTPVRYRAVKTAVAND